MKDEENNYENSWVVVLAAGEGTRVQELSKDHGGSRAPKQYCPFGTEKTLLRRSLERAFALVPPERIVVVVAPHHEEWWRHELKDLPEKNILVQPRNRGTASGVLFPLVEILAREPDARILFLPSDHYVELEEVLQNSLREALALTYWHEDQILLLGVTPEKPDSQYGYIEHSPEGWDGLYRVQRFREKPSYEAAEALIRQGALWNSFMFLGSGRILLHLFTRYLPDLRPLVEWRYSLKNGDNPKRVLAEVYEALPTYDFSRDLLEKAVGNLYVYPVPHCGWSDLGTPERLHRFFQNTAPQAKTLSKGIRSLRKVANNLIEGAPG